MWERKGLKKIYAEKKTEGIRKRRMKEQLQCLYNVAGSKNERRTTIKTDFEVCGRGEPDWHSLNQDKKKLR